MSGRRRHGPFGNNCLGSKQDYEYCFTMKNICEMLGSIKPVTAFTNKVLEETGSLLCSNSKLTTYERLVVNNRIWLINFVKEIMEDDEVVDDKLADAFEKMTEAFGTFAAMIPKCYSNSDDRFEYIDETKVIYQGYKYKSSLAESNIKMLYTYMEGEALHLLYKYAPSEF